MIYLFTGNNSFLIYEELKKWKHIFIEKNGDFNLLHIQDTLSTDFNFLSENLLGQSLFGGKKFIIIEGYPFPATIERSEDDSGKSAKKSNTQQNEVNIFFEKYLPSVPMDNIVVFVSPKADKRMKSYVSLCSIAKIRDFSFTDNDEEKNWILKKYNSRISRDALNLLFSRKAGDLGKIVFEIEKLLLSIQSIEMHDIQKHIIPEMDENIFIIVDNILNKNLTLALTEMKNMLFTVNHYAFYNSLLGSIRGRVYMDLLKQQGCTNNEIVSMLNLGKKAFLVTKNYTMNFYELQSFYLALIEIDKKMKFGHMKGSETKDFLYEMEKLFLEKIV